MTLVIKKQTENGSPVPPRRIGFLRFLLALPLFCTLITCTNLNDAKPTQRATFVHFYGGVGNFDAVAAEQIGDGFILIGDSLATDDFGIIIIKTDAFGNQIWRKRVEHCQASSIAVVSDGYLVIGDSIKVDLKAAQVSDIYRRKSTLIKIDDSGNVMNQISYGDTTVNPQKRVDFTGNALALQGDQIVTINGMKSQNGNTKAVVSSLRLTGPATADTLWSQTLFVLNRDFLNSKSVHILHPPDGSADEVIWTSSPTQETQNATKAYVSVPVIREESTYENNNVFGINDDLFYSGNDIQQSTQGYGIIGTFQTITGGNKNIYFIRADRAGNIEKNSERFFDGDPDQVALTTDNRASSTTDDEGTALIGTPDGGFLLAGSTTTTPKRGNGGKDILLIRVDPSGTLIWQKNLGGSGDESVNTIRLTSDGGFLICGTLDLAGLKSMFIIKTDQNGDLNN